MTRVGSGLLGLALFYWRNSMAGKKKKSTDKKKVSAKILGTGGARRAADAMINRHKQLEDVVNGSYGKRGK